MNVLESSSYQQKARELLRRQHALVRLATPTNKVHFPQDVLGKLMIPRIKIEAAIEEGADETSLARAVGHIPGTASPGTAGNIGLAGHRDTFFRPLRDISVGDVIQIETPSATDRYRVDAITIVGPDDISVLSQSGGRRLTLVTCYPFSYFGHAPKRYVVGAFHVDH